MTDSPDSEKPGAAPAGPQELDPRYLQALAQDITTQLMLLIGGHMPDADISQEEIGVVVGKLTQEQIYIGSVVMPSFIDDAAVETCPQARIVIQSPSGVEANFTVSKRAGDDPIEALSTTLLLAFLLAAPVRGLLLLKGFKYRFQQVKAPSRILLPK